MKEIVCNRDIELLAVGLRPYYMSREFSHAIAVVAYVPSCAHAETACDRSKSCQSELKPEAHVLLQAVSLTLSILEMKMFKMSFKNYSCLKFL